MADALGRKDRERARELGQRLVNYGVAMGGFLAITYAGLEIADPDFLPRLFTEDAGIIDKVRSCIPGPRCPPFLIIILCTLPRFYRSRQSSG